MTDSSNESELQRILFFSFPQSALWKGRSFPQSAEDAEGLFLFFDFTVFFLLKENKLYALPLLTLFLIYRTKNIYGLMKKKILCWCLLRWLKGIYHIRTTKSYSANILLRWWIKNFNIVLNMLFWMRARLRQKLKHMQATGEHNPLLHLNRWYLPHSCLFIAILFVNLNWI